MNFQAECKKSLVRNTKQTLPKVSVTTKQSSSVEALKNVKQITARPKSELNLAIPSLNSSKGLVKKMKDMEKVKHDERNGEDRSRKVAVQEKITKQMNFHYNQAIYKDLIPICTKTTQPATQPSRNPLPLKDKEPKLEDFTKRKQFNEYTYQPTASTKLMKPIREYDGFKMYRFKQKFL